MKKICFLTNTMGYGGATKIMIEIANFLSLQSEFAVSIMTYDKDPFFYKVNDNIEIVYVTKTKCNIPKIRLLTQLRLINKALKKKSYDLIIAFTNTDKLFAVFSSLLKKQKVMLSERQDPYNYVPRKKHIMWLRYILSDACVFQTEGAMNYFPNIVRKKSIVIPNFIDISDDLKNSEVKKEKTIAFSARFELKQKRQDVMVKAFKLVHDRFPDWKLIFYGDGPDQDIVEQLSSKLDLEESIIFYGKTSNVLSKVKSSSIFALSSDYEGIPNVVLEAMAIGMPVVSTDCSPGGARLLIKNGINGLLVPTNSPEKLASAIINLITDNDLSDRCGQCAKEVNEKFSPERILPMWKEFILQVMK